MTNNQTESLLSRFAAVPQRLKGTGAPGVPGWCNLDSHVIDSEVTDDGVVNPQACLAACVMWAMEVAMYCINKQSMMITVPEIWTTDDWRWCVIRRSQSFSKQGGAPTFADAACDMLESIADAIGGG